MGFDPIAATEAAKKIRALRKGKNYKQAVARSTILRYLHSIEVTRNG